MFSKKYRNFIFALVMSATMAFIMTGIVTAINIGFNSGYLRHWGKAFLVAWPIAFCMVLVIGPYIRVFAERVCTRE